MIIVKIGGASLTDKQQFETICSGGIAGIIGILAKVIQVSGEPVIVVHGAGSFGHFTASKFGLAQGGNKDLDKEKIKFHIAQTRSSVFKLNQIVVSEMLLQGIAAVSLSPFPFWISKNQFYSQESIEHFSASVQDVLKKGLVPVIHGDVILDQDLGCTILSGDKIVSSLSVKFKPKRVVFMTNVNGIFDQPPDDERANLLRKLEVDKNGNISKCFLQDGKSSVSKVIQTQVSSTDSTGGMTGKLAEMIKICQTCRIPTRVVKAGTDDSFSACVSENIDINSKWIGTEFSPGN